MIKPSVNRHDPAIDRIKQRILSQSGTPLFVSCQPSEAKGIVEQELLTAFKRASAQGDTLLPLDWMENTCPERWLLNGEEIHFQWTGDEQNAMSRR